MSDRAPAPDAAQREFLGVRFDLLHAAAARAWVFRRLAARDFAYVVTPNVDHIVQKHRSDDPEVEQAYNGAALRLCDSRILARLARLSNVTLPVVPGSDLTREILDNIASGTPVAVVGGDGELHRQIAARYPGLEWSFHSPPMGVRRNSAARSAIVEFAEAANAHLLLFAIGAPQSELVCAEIARRGKAGGTALCIGASLEFLTGAKRRAPRWIQRIGFEWLHRLASEPRRLWRRYLVDGPRIFPIWWRWHALRTGRPPAGSDSSLSDGG